MSWTPIGADQWLHRRRPVAGETPASDIPQRLILAGFLLRTIFIVAILIVTVHVAMPQRASIWTLYDTPGDLVRVVLGFAVCAWIAVQLFAMPTDKHAIRTWLYLGLAAVPFALICIFGTW